MAMMRKFCQLCGDEVSYKEFLCVEGTRLIKCKTCGLVLIDPLPSKEEITAYYSTNEIEIPNSADELMHKRYLDIIKLYSSTGSLLDIGAWYGDFLYAASRYGWKTVGVEPNKDACEKVQQNYGIEMVHGTIVDALVNYGEDSFDISTMFHVIEHIPNPMEYITEVSKILKPGGLLVIRTPNINAVLFSIIKEHWGHLALPVHLYFYSPETLKLLLEKCGFKVLHSSTLSCPMVNEVFELLKGGLKFIGIKRFLIRVNTKRGIITKQMGSRKQVGIMPSLKGAVNKATMPLFYITLPIWYYFEKIDRGSELFVIAKKEY